MDLTQLDSNQWANRLTADSGQGTEPEWLQPMVPSLQHMAHLQASKHRAAIPTVLDIQPARTHTQTQGLLERTHTPVCTPAAVCNPSTLWHLDPESHLSQPKDTQHLLPERTEDIQHLPNKLNNHLR